MFIERVLKLDPDSVWYPRNPSAHWEWDAPVYAVDLRRLMVTYRSNLGNILREFNPTMNQRDSILTRAMCCILLLKDHGDHESVNKLLIELEI